MVSFAARFAAQAIKKIDINTIPKVIPKIPVSFSLK